MHTFNFEIDLAAARAPTDVEQKVVFEQILEQGLQSRYAKGLPNSKGRVLYRLLSTVDKSPGTEIQIEPAARELLEEVFLNDATLFAPGFFRAVAQYAERVKEIK